MIPRCNSGFSPASRIQCLAMFYAFISTSPSIVFQSRKQDSVFGDVISFAFTVSPLLFQSRKQDSVFGDDLWLSCLLYTPHVSVPQAGFSVWRCLNRAVWVAKLVRFQSRKQDSVFGDTLVCLNAIRFQGFSPASRIQCLAIWLVH